MGILEPGEIGHRQQLIMQCVWEAGDVATVPEIMDRLEQKCGKRLTRQAVNTLILPLVEKGYLVQGEKEGKAYQYHAMISEKQYRIDELKRFGNLTFGGSASAMVATMLESDISRDELKKIQELLEKMNG